MRFVALLAVLSALLLTATPVAASPITDQGRGGQWGHHGQGSHWDQDDRDDDDDDDDDEHDWDRDDGDRDDDDGDDDDRDDDDDDDDGDGGPGPKWHQTGWGGDWHPGRRGIFQNRADGLRDDHADTLSDVFQDCVSTHNLRDLRFGQLWHLIHTIGLTQRERERIHSLRDLSDELWDNLDDRLDDLKLRQILQVGHACGLSSRDVLAILLNV